VVQPSVAAHGESQDSRDLLFPAGFGSESVKISPGRGDLEIHYAALSFRAPERNKFKYKLEGLDPDWIEAGTRQVAYYNNLAPGNYRFHVVACNNDGVWNNEGAILPVILQPHLWQTWWFRGAAVVLVAGLIGGAARYTTRKRMARKLERLEQQHAIEKERSRIARDMHDELGAKLTRISFQGASAKRRLADPAEAELQIEGISRTARELVSSLDEIVWAVDPENDSLDSLANYVSRYASEFFDDSSVECHLRIPGELPASRLATDVRHNVFLSVKEALNNVLKHSGATRVEVELRASGREVELIITDNGVGMPLIDSNGGGSARTRRTGHGLANMRERLTAIKGRCEVISEPGKGTKILLALPLAKDSTAMKLLS
jgi:signal transduction histidine kinase